ncbi:MAG: peptide-methionine (S)-S-oxide reductase [Deltaproteobacteria bacterium]|nr:peptide-methionine (S)-S-oxide reductase [Deltaproteobacteria bacterium]
MRTRVGYAGGTSVAPTYHELGDHTEAFQLDFDPTKLTYDELLDAFWTAHQPERESWSRQYMAAVFCESPEQESRANQARDRIAALRNIEVRTPVIVGARFYLAEDYHQKYYLRHDAVLMRELASYRPRELTDSTVAARLNGYVAGRGLMARLRDELPSFGLSVTASEHLEKVVRAKQRRA